MRTGTMILLGGAASLAIAAIGTFSTVHAGTVERVDRGGYFACVRSGLNVGPDNTDQPWQCVPPVAAAVGADEEAAPEPQPGPECSKGHKRGHKHHGKRDLFARF